MGWFRPFSPRRCSLTVPADPREPYEALSAVSNERNPHIGSVANLQTDHAEGPAGTRPLVANCGNWSRLSLRLRSELQLACWWTSLYAALAGVNGGCRMRAATYTRVSTSEQNPELQLREIQDYASRQGWEIVEAY